MKNVLFAVIAVVVLVGLLGGGCVVSGYNRAMSLDANVKQQWAQVENQLQRRYELIPNLVATVKGEAGQEQKIFLGIAEAQKGYFQAKTVPEKAEAANQVESALSRLLVLSQQYPALKSNESFLKLQDTIEGTENRLSVERGRYNDAVKELDVYMRQFPTSFYAHLAGVTQPEYFKVPEAAKTAPKVDFSSP
jgi:LemA protein